MVNHPNRSQQKARDLLRSLVADIDAMWNVEAQVFGPFDEYDETIFGPFSEYAGRRGMAVSWPNLAILRDEAKALLEESQ